MKRFSAGVLAFLLVLGLAPWFQGVAGAAPGEPTLSSPSDGATVESNPILQWQSVVGAVRYRVQVDDNADFTSLLVNVVTYNTRYGHTTDLPLTTLYWRVAALDAASAQGPFSTARSFDKQAPAGPTLSQPADGAVLSFPTQSPVFSWLPFPGAKNYQIEIDNESGFQAPLILNATTTTNTSYALATPPSMGQTFYWRVRAMSQNNLPSQYSSVRSYSWTWPVTPTLLTPADDNSPANAVEELVFEWSATPGAVSYELQASPNDLFQSLTLNVGGIHSTRYSPPTTLDNGAYYWRVRARNGADAPGDWSAVSTFYRAWPAPDAPPNHRVTLLTPTDDDVAVVVPVFQWTPVRLASSYALEFGTDELFSPGTYDTCITQQTSFIPTSDCNPAPGTDYYWRVKPLDGAINGLYSPTFHFQYDPTVPQQLSPADGSLGLVGPVELKWNPVPNIGRYRVTILKSGGAVAEQGTTYAQSYVPQNLNPADGPFSWYVQAMTMPGQLGVIPNPATYWTFNFTAPVVFAAAPDPITPDGTAGTHVPNLTWQPVNGATTYDIWRATFPSTTYSLFKSGLKVNSYTEVGNAVAPATYTWYVQAKSGASVLADGAIGTFVVEPMAAATLTSPAHCAVVVNCTAESVTPTFTWDWDPDADRYLIYLASDPNFTNILPGYNGVTVHFPVYRPTSSLPDAQAGQATYWYARPCYGVRCAPEPGSYAGSNPPIFAFRKRSNAVVQNAPADELPDATPLVAHQDQVTFSWDDYLQTNLAADQPNDLEARNYQVKISTSADMQTVIHTSPVVDQTTYTPYNQTLPDGPLYWTVQAFDQSGNALSVSDTWLVHKRSPIPTPLTPAPGATVAAAPLFTWASQLFAGRYEIEVYKNVDQPLAAPNRVYSTITPMTAWAPTSALASGQYGWRIRRQDSNNRPGPWSADTNAELRLFTVAGNQVSLLSPADGASFPDDNQSFSWTPVSGAAQYRIETSTSPAFSTTTESVATVMTSWHSTIHYANGTYYWRVKTIDGGGNVTATSATRSFVHGPPQPAPVYYHPLTPARILDSRPAFQVGPYGTPWGSATVRNVAVAGFSGVPAGADAVTLNVTVTGTTASSFLKIWPKGQTEPNASSLNWVAGTTIANAVTMTVGADASVSIRNHFGSTDVVVDVVGYYDSDSVLGGGFTSLGPTRVLDSRTTSKWGPGAVRAVVVAGGATGVPANADAVVLNVTATGPTQDSFLTIWPTGAPQPSASSLNFTAGQTIPNSVTAKVGTGGSVNIFNNAGQVDVVVDVVGYFDVGVGTAFHPLDAPVRIQDSRPTFQVGPYNTKWGNGTDRTVQGTGETPANVPGSADSVLLNVTVTNATAGSFLTIYPDGSTRPTASSLNWVGGQTVPNAVTAKLGTSGRIRAYNYFGQVDVIMDIFGYYG